MTTKTRMHPTLALAVFLLLLGPSRVWADDILNVNIDTSGLNSLANSEVFFILTGAGGNTATLSNISLGGGTVGPVDLLSTTGGTSPTNSLASGIALNDSASFLTVFAQTFSAGSALSFLLDLTTNVVSPTPDQFSVEIVDPLGNLLPTSDPTGFNNLFTINLDSANPITNIYSSLVTTSAPTPTPEPSSFLLLLACGLPLFIWTWNCRKAARA